MTGREKKRRCFSQPRPTSPVVDLTVSAPSCAEEDQEKGIPEERTAENMVPEKRTIEAQDSFRINMGKKRTHHLIENITLN